MPSRAKPAVRRFPVRSEEHLKELALRYLARFPCTAAKLRSHLRTKMKAAVAAGEAPSGALGPWVDGVIARLERVQLLDDARYSEHRAATLHRRGRSLRFIRRDLEHRGAFPEAVVHAIDGLATDVPATDLVAALRLAEKKRLGPFAAAATRREHRQRHLAALARAGFPFDVARTVIDARDADTARDLVRPPSDPA
jgi:regulatory protein